MSSYPIDFEYWQSLPVVSVFEAVVLSFGFDPKKVGDYEKDLPDYAERIEERAEIVHANMKIMGGDIVEHECYEGDLGAVFDSTLRMGEFVWFATSKGWGLPEEFKGVKRRNSEKFQEKERNQMLIVLLAMAIDRYGYDPKQRNKATGSGGGSIRASVQKLGLDVDEKTIQKYLKQAFEITEEKK